MKKIKLMYYIALLVLPFILIGMINLVSNEKINIKSTNLELAIKNDVKESKVIPVEVYGEGFEEGDHVFIEGEKVDTRVVYNKMITCEIPVQYIDKGKISFKVHRQNDIGKTIKASNNYVANVR
ncbi:MAG: hypothetical protein AB9856_18910 [Cellulosilyticaceae bacterium]